MDGASGGSVIDAGRQLARRLPRLRKRGGSVSTHGIGKPTVCTTWTTRESLAAPIMAQRRLFRSEPLRIRVGAHAALVKGHASLNRRSAAPRDDGNRSGRRGARHRHLGATANALAPAGITVRRRRGAGMGRVSGAYYAVTGTCGGVRVAQDLSQERLARAAGIDRAPVGRVGRGWKNVTISILEAMARALAVAHLLVEPDGEGGRPASLKAGRKPAHEPRAHRMAPSAAARRLRSARISRSSRQGLVSSDAGPGACTLSSTRSLRTSARRVQAGMARNA